MNERTRRTDSPYRLKDRLPALGWSPPGGMSRTEEQLAFQAALLYHLQAAVIAVDCEERVSYLNPAAAELYGVSPVDAMGQKLSDIYQHFWLSPEAEAQVYATLAEQGQWVQISIRDEGQGFDLSSLPKDSVEHGAGFPMLMSVCSF